MPDDLILRGRVFQTDGAAKEKDPWPSECMHKGKKKKGVSEEEHSWQAGLYIYFKQFNQVSKNRQAEAVVL